MQELALHIEYLLKRHDCVIVPGFGAFLASRRRAAYSPESVLPSSVEFFFNSAVCNDDGLLASSFARRNRLSFEEAKVVLAEESESLRAAIDSYGEATIGRVGVLRRGEEGTITLEKVDTWIYTSWREQVFCFENRRLEEILTVLARWYNVEVSYESEALKALKLSGTMDKYKEIRPFLQIFEPARM